MWCALLIGSLLFSLGVPNFASAAASVYEGFDYSPVGSDLNGNSGGTGFGGPWVPGGYNASISENYDIAVGSLTFGSLVVSGHRVQSLAVGALAGLTRPLSQPLGADGTTRYISFLVRPEGTLGAGAFNGFFGLILHRPDAFPGANPEPPELYVGKPGGGQIDQYILENRGGDLQIPSGATAQSGQTVLVVVRADFTAGTDKFTLYMNPTPGCPEPTQGIVKQDMDGGTITELTIYSTGEFSMDELRVGNSFADVTPALPAPAYEGFDYSPAGSDLNGQNGGTGFAGPWVPGGYNASLNDNYDIAAGSLTFGSLLVTGNRVYSPAVNAAIAGLTRPLSQCLGTPGTTRYISFLVRPEGTLDGGGFLGLILHRPDAFPGANPEPLELFVGKPGGGAVHDYVLEDRGGSGQVDSGVQVEIGKTVLVVIKAEFTEGNDKFTLYVNPSPGCPEPSAGTVKQDMDAGMITELTLYSTGEFSLDELRVGNTFADVTPIAPTAPLTINCPDNLVLVCGQDNAATIAAWLASVTGSGGCGTSQVIHNFAGLSDGNCGTATVTFIATDECCGIATCTRTISVAAWQFTGFFPPVENPPAYNRAKAGSGIPVKFSLGGDKGLNIFAPGYPASGPAPCDFTTAPIPIQETVTAGSSTLSYDPATDQYTYVWKTEKAWAGTCRELIVKLADGTSHSAYFSFTR